MEFDWGLFCCRTWIVSWLYSLSEQLFFWVLLLWSRLSISHRIHLIAFCAILLLLWVHHTNWLLGVMTLELLTLMLKVRRLLLTTKAWNIVNILSSVEYWRWGNLFLSWSLALPIIFIWLIVHATNWKATFSARWGMYFDWSRTFTSTRVWHLLMHVLLTELSKFFFWWDHSVYWLMAWILLLLMLWVYAFSVLTELWLIVIHLRLVHLRGILLCLLLHLRLRFVPTQRKIGISAWININDI